MKSLYVHVEDSERDGLPVNQWCLSPYPHDGSDTVLFSQEDPSDEDIATIEWIAQLTQEHSEPEAITQEALQELGWKRVIDSYMPPRTVDVDYTLTIHFGDSDEVVVESFPGIETMQDLFTLCRFLGIDQRP